MKLSKTIPSRVKTVEFLWCKKDWLEMSSDYRYARRALKNKLDKCYWCNYKFKDGEMMALACPRRPILSNIFLCKKCCDELTQPEQR